MATLIGEDSFDLWDLLPERSDMMPYEMGIIYFQKSKGPQQRIPQNPERKWEYDAIYKTEEGNKIIASVVISSLSLEKHMAHSDLSYKLVVLSGYHNLPGSWTLRAIEVSFITLMGLKVRERE